MAFLLFEPDEPQSLDWYLRVADKFKQFLSIYTDSLTYILSLEGVSHDRTISICTIPMPDYKEVPKGRWDDFVLSIYNMSDDVAEILNRWYALEQEDINIYLYREYSR